MATMSRATLHERVAEMKRQLWPHASAERLRMVFDPPETWAKLIEREATLGQIDAYLHGYLAPSLIEDNTVVKNDCPCCGHGWFSWGLAWGAGSCSCGWPGRLYHVVSDRRDDPDLICSLVVNGKIVCGERRGDHISREQIVQSRNGSRVEVVLDCPVQDEHGFSRNYRPPEIARFQLLLWAHPYTVHPR